jgi:PKD repeat protein
VEDVSGAGIPGVPVTFTADQGTLGAGAATSDSNGVARTTLNATRNTVVTVNVAGKTATVNVNLNPRTGISVTGPTTSVAAGTPVTFTVGVGTAANIRDVSIDFGDGARSSLGAISTSTPVQHTYAEAGTYRVSATATEASGFTETVATFVTILPQQPPSVVIQASSSNPGLNQTVIFTAVVSGATSTILRYEWNFGDNATPATASTTGNRATASYSRTGTKIITVRVIQAVGPEGEGSTAITVGTVVNPVQK